MNVYRRLRALMMTVAAVGCALATVASGPAGAASQLHSGAAVGGSARAAASGPAWAMSGGTSQGLSVRLHVSFNLSKVNRLVIRWRATCTSGTTFTDSTAVSRIPVSPFPRFDSSGSYVFSGKGTSGNTYSFAVSTDLHGSLLRNIRARGTWSAQALVRDASGNQVDSCSTGLIRWRAHGS